MLFISKKYIVVVGIIACISGCKPPKMTNAATIPRAYYKFNKQKSEVKSILDSIIINNQFFFTEESDEPDHLFLNLKNKVDTITFVLFFKDENIDNKLDDASILFVMNINRYINRKLDETPLYPKMHSLQEKVYLNNLDSFIITPLRKHISEMK
jgi:hypothetical protein